MATLQDKIKQQDSIINEMEQYFVVQKIWLNDRDDFVKLDKMKKQGAKVEQMIRDSKKPIPSLRGC